MKVTLTRQANIQPGTYTFKILDVTYGEGANGTYARLNCEIQDGSERVLPLYLSFSPAARWKVESFLDAIGAPHEGEADYEDFVGMTFKAVVTLQEKETGVFPVIGTLLPSETIQPITPKPKPSQQIVRLPGDVVKPTATGGGNDS